MWLFFLLVACDVGPTSAADCIPTTGDNCDCKPKCMTQGELDRIRGRCDLGCYFDSGLSTEPTWSCTIVDGECAVAE